MTSQSEHLRLSVQRLQRQVRERDEEIADLRRRFRHPYRQAEDLNARTCQECGLDFADSVYEREEVRR